MNPRDEVQALIDEGIDARVAAALVREKKTRREKSYVKHTIRHATGQSPKPRSYVFTKAGTTVAI